MLKRLIGTVLLLGLAGLAAWQLSPWPSALFYRFLFDRGGVAMNDALAGHVPAGVTARHDLSYGTDVVEKLDVYLPADALGSSRRLPAIVWIHGGGFLSGDKSQIANYLEIVAAAGYAVAGVNYTLAPAARHPTPTRQVNAALAYLVANAATLNIDPDRILLAGDSAGAQLAAQLAIAIGEPGFASVLGFAPALPRPALRGLVLDCGMFDPDRLNVQGPMAGFLTTVAWSYLGTKDLGGPEMPSEFSIVRNVTAAMPPMFITAGNADPLLPQSKALAEIGRELGVPIDALFFADDHDPPLGHEYQFDLETAAGKEALARTLAFAAERVR